MPNMETRVLTLRGSLQKGKCSTRLEHLGSRLTLQSFGWVNASYVYGLQIATAHMRRALGALIPYEKFSAATEQPSLASLHI